MSLFRAVRSLVTRPKETEESSNSNTNETKGGEKKNIDQAFQTKIDKVKSLWTLYSNARDENERISQLHKLLPRFVSTYKEQDFPLVQSTLVILFSPFLSISHLFSFSFGERNLKQFTFVASKKLVDDIRTIWKPNLPPEANSKSVVKMLSSSSEDKGCFDLLCALEISCSSVSILKSFIFSFFLELIF